MIGPREFGKAILGEPARPPWTLKNGSVMSDRTWCVDEAFRATARAKAVGSQACLAPIARKAAPSPLATPGADDRDYQRDAFGRLQAAGMNNIGELWGAYLQSAVPIQNLFPSRSGNVNTEPSSSRAGMRGMPGNTGTGTNIGDGNGGKLAKMLKGNVPGIVHAINKLSSTIKGLIAKGQRTEAAHLVDELGLLMIELRRAHTVG